MRISSFLIPTAAFAGAAGLSLVVAGFAATALENNSEIVVRRTLDEAGFSWAEVVADGLRVELSGEAPDEAKRFAAISKIGTVVDASRICCAPGESAMKNLRSFEALNCRLKSPSAVSSRL